MPKLNLSHGRIYMFGVKPVRAPRNPHVPKSSAACRETANGANQPVRDNQYSTTTTVLNYPYTANPNDIIIIIITMNQFAKSLLLALVATVFSADAFAPATFSARRATAAMAVVDIDSEAAFDNTISSAGSSLVVVDYSTTWCGPCKVIAPKFDEFSEKYPDAVFLKVRNLHARLQIPRKTRGSGRESRIEQDTGSSFNQVCSTINSHFLSVLSPFTGYW